GLWNGHREDRLPVGLKRYLGDAANEEVYCELRYQGQIYDAETGLYYNRHRYYDADSGQYISPDPIGLAGGLRPQGYVHNPLEWVDPLGLVGCPDTNKPDSDTSKTAQTKKPVAGKITGYTKHGLNQAIGRNGGKGVNAKDMLDAVKNPKKVVENANGTIKYQGKRATVVLNGEGKVVTTFGKSRGPEIWSQGTSRISGSGSAQQRANDFGFSYNPKAVR
ncbi:RHS repeat-associated core domain-containing protein, partial [Lonsdalea quercina]|uniref:RHS repeat-associated core domain-containing protein n=1 Tax=Lonsdalea quercina TaxID=71657 RepID=UPI003976AF93